MSDPPICPLLYSDCKTIHANERAAHEKRSEKKEVGFFFEVRLARRKKASSPKNFSSLFSSNQRIEKIKLLRFSLFLNSLTRCRSPPSLHRGPRFQWRLCRQGMAGIITGAFQRRCSRRRRRLCRRRRRLAPGALEEEEGRKARPSAWSRPRRPGLRCL